MGDDDQLIGEELNGQHALDYRLPPTSCCIRCASESTSLPGFANRFDKLLGAATGRLPACPIGAVSHELGELLVIVTAR